MHKDYDVVSVELSGDATQEQKDELTELMGEWQDAMIEDQKDIAKTLNVSLGAASSIQYLRTRSRWTQNKENELVRLDQAGEKFPDVLSGDF